MELYVDNAATTKMSKAAINAMLPYFDTYYGNPSSLHTFGQVANESLTNAREKISSLIGCSPSEIFFTSGGSESDNQALQSIAAIGAKQNKKHIISSKFEHHAILHSLKKLESLGFEITLLDVHENGIISPKELENAITDKTCLVTIMYANNEIGTIQPINEIAKICHQHNIIFHTDAVQAIGHLPINVKTQNIDLLSASAHKFHGPKGVGFLYVKKGILLESLIEGGSQEKGKRAGTENLPGIIGMTKALEESCKNMKENNLRFEKLRNQLINDLSSISHSILNGDKENRLANNVNFCFEGIEGESLLLLLNDRGIFASSGSACTSGSLNPSHVLLAIGRPHEIAHGSLRLSLSEEITENDIEYIISNVKEVVQYLRSISPVWQDLIHGKKNFIIK